MRRRKKKKVDSDGAQKAGKAAQTRFHLTSAGRKAYCALAVLVAAHARAAVAEWREKTSSLTQAGKKRDTTSGSGRQAKKRARTR